METERRQLCTFHEKTVAWLQKYRPNTRKHNHLHSIGLVRVKNAVHLPTSWSIRCAWAGSRWTPVSL